MVSKKTLFEKSLFKLVLVQIFFPINTFIQHSKLKSHSHQVQKFKGAWEKIKKTTTNNIEDNIQKYRRIK